MGISCSLKGHQWGDPEVETETLEKEGGSIQIKQKLRTCIKCDETKVLKQQKVARKTMTDKNNSNEREVAADGGSFEPESNDEGVVIMGDDDDDEETSATDESTVETQTTHTEDDLDAGAFDAKRDIEDVGPEGQGEPEKSTADRDYDGIVPESEENNVELLGTPDDDNQQSTTTREHTDEETGRSPSSPSDAQVTHTDEASTSWKDKEAESGEAKLVCPDCSFSAPLDDVPVYSGDACPECRRGYLQKK